jgi:hypothetical protein
LGSENKRIRKPINSLSTTQQKFTISSWVGANAKKQEERQNQNLEGKLQEKHKDISYLKDHNQNLLVQLNESKDKKHRDQKLEQANHDLIY